MKSVVEQTAAVVRGTVSAISYSFDDQRGPRTNVTLVSLTTELGPTQAAPLILRIFGGPLPDGSYTQASELPRFALGGTYLVFLANHDWFFSPVIGAYAFRIQSVGGKELLVSQEGTALLGFDDRSVVGGNELLARPIGAEATARFALTPFTAPSPSELEKAASVTSFTAALKSYHPTGMKQTAFDGSFAQEPNLAVVGTKWDQTATLKGAGLMVDGGPAGPEGGPK